MITKNQTKLTIKKKANDKLRYYVTLVDTEISGMAKSRITEEGDIVIEDFIIFKQECSGGSTEPDEASMAQFLFELQENDEDPKDWNVWWHSHCNVGTFWSVTDTDTIKDHCMQDYLISLVTNKAGDYKARLDVFPKDHSPFNKRITGSVEFELDVFTEIAKGTNENIAKAEEEIEGVIKLKEKLDEEYKETLEKLEAELELVSLNEPDDKELEKYCKKDIKKNVTEKYAFNSNDKNKYDYTPPHHNRYKKIKKKDKWQWWEEDYYLEDGPDVDEIDFKGKDEGEQTEIDLYECELSPREMDELGLIENLDGTLCYRDGTPYQGEKV